MSSSLPSPPAPARLGNRGVSAAVSAALVLVAILVARYQFYLSDYDAWGDESETIVAARMMAAGMSLYSEIFNHHGPLTFLPAYLLELFGSFGVSAHRVAIFALQWIALASLFFSPMVADRSIRALHAALAACVMVIYLPEMYGETYTYQPIAGLLLVVVLAQYTLPAIACPERLGPARILAGNALLACLPFFAVTYAPLAGLLFLASLRRPYIARAVAFAAIGVAANVLFLLATGSIPGYLAFHIYLNSTILPLYNGGHGPAQLLPPVLAALTQTPRGIFALLVVIASAVALAWRGPDRFSWRPLMVAVALLTLLIRPGFHQVPFYYGALALPLAFLPLAARLPLPPAPLALAVLLACVARLSLFSAGDRDRMVAGRIPATTEFAQLARAVTRPGERIIAYTFLNHEYMAADRLPASGHFFYLPWQEKYNENPKFGIRIDACAQIRAARPKVITLDKGTVWGMYPWASYAQCVQAFVDSDYYQVHGKPFYVRKDLPAADIGVAAPGEAHTMAATPPLTDGAPIELRMSDVHRRDDAALRRIGVLLGTHNRHNAGDARLELAGPNAQPVAIAFPLADLEDNRYRFFELSPGRYDRGRLSHLTGGGISAWQSHRDAQTTTCIIYDYANGKRRFTPGCPLL